MKKILYMLSFFALLSNAICANKNKSQEEKSHRIVNLEPTVCSNDLARYEINDYNRKNNSVIEMCAKEIYDRITSVCKDPKSEVKNVDLSSTDIKGKIIRILTFFLTKHKRKYVIITRAFSKKVNWTTYDKEYDITGRNRIINTSMQDINGKLTKIGIEIKGIHKTFSPSNNCIEVRFLKEFD